MNQRSIDALKRKVLTVLQEEPNTRNSDKELTIRVWKRFYLGESASGISFEQLYDLPSEDQIKRVRARIQNADRLCLPTDPEVAKNRRIQEEFWKACMREEFGPSYSGSYRSKHISMTICDCLAYHKITIEEFAKKRCIDLDELDKICQGIRRITPFIALQFHIEFGGSMNFWLNLQEAVEENKGYIRYV